VVFINFAEVMNKISFTRRGHVRKRKQSKFYLEGNENFRTKNCNVLVVVYISQLIISCMCIMGRRGRVRMVVGFTATYAISAYHP